jgi:hypothetical protein
MLKYLKFKNFKGTFLEIPSILLFVMVWIFIPFFIWSKTLYLLKPILNYFTSIIAMIIVWPYIINPILDRFIEWFTKD